jgi:hypothetical protein
MCGLWALRRKVIKFDDFSIKVDTIHGAITAKIQPAKKQNIAEGDCFGKLNV